MILEDVKRKISARVFEASRNLAGLAGLLKGGEPLPFTRPPPHVRADLSLPWPLQAAKLSRRNPMEVAAELAEALRSVVEVEDPRASPPGFVNFRLSAAALGGILAEILARPEACGADPHAPSRPVLIEFVSANPTGPLHLASGRAAALGDSLARILRRRGRKVWEEYYVNDAGDRVRLLGESLQARREQLRGKDRPVPEKGYQGEYLKEMAANLPAEAERWDADALGRWAMDRLIASHKDDMRDFRVDFDRWFLESELYRTREGGGGPETPGAPVEGAAAPEEEGHPAPPPLSFSPEQTIGGALARRGPPSAGDASAVEEALTWLRERGMAYEKDGAVWLGTRAVEGADDDKDRVLVRSDGRPTYFLADIAYHKDKFDRGWEELIDVWGADHHGYVPRMTAAVAAMGRPPEAFHAIIHQLVHLYRGKEAVKMSKRAGEFVTLRELMTEAGTDACRFFFAMRTPNSHMNFDVELAKRRSQENPVYYAQYVHARICSVFREAKKAGLGLPPPDGAKSACSALAKPQERALLVKLAWFPDVLADCEKTLSPHPLPTYLLELAGLFHPFYEECRVVDPGDPSLSKARLALCAGVRDVIREGLGLLGVASPESM